MFEPSAASFYHASGQNNVLEELKDRFSKLWERCLHSDQAVGAEIFSALATYYGQPFRQYHNFNHIRYCLRQFDQCTMLIHEPDALELGLWFHDVIYVSGAKDNERRSADLFHDYAVKYTANTALRRHIEDLIMETTHNSVPCCNDGQFIMDIDVSGFGQDWEDFMEDGLRLRAESDELEDQVYYSKLLKFMRFLSSRSTFFFTAYFQQRYEQNAQNNMRRLIADLTMCGYA